MCRFKHGAFAARHVAAASAIGLTLSGCVHVRQERMAAGEVPVLTGAAVRSNFTPMDAPLACLGAALRASGGRRPIIAVGDVRDYTGKYSINEGNAITQGGALMTYSALGKLAGGVAVAERFDSTIAERELGYTDRRQLGDGEAHGLAGNAGAAAVPWLPYYGGTIIASDYYIVGGITELNYDIRSGGVEAALSQMGPKARTFTQAVAIDLRIVDTRSLMVVQTISLTKQFTGYEVGLNIFRFFGSNLFDLNLGAKAQEPLQLGIRTAIEEATLRLVAAVTKTDPDACLSRASLARNPGGAKPSPAAAERTRGAPAPLVPINAADAAGTSTAGAIRFEFEHGSADLPPNAMALVERAVTAYALAPLELVLVARDSETLDGAARDALTDRRVATLLAALVSRGVHENAFAMLWRPARDDTAVRGDGAGFQLLARIRVGR